MTISKGEKRAGIAIGLFVSYCLGYWAAPTPSALAADSASLAVQLDQCRTEKSAMGGARDAIVARSNKLEAENASLKDENAKLSAHHDYELKSDPSGSMWRFDKATGQICRLIGDTSNKNLNGWCSE